MSNKNKKLEKSAAQQEAKELAVKDKVLMRFSENKYYNDLENPIFEKGKTYVLEGAGWIQRWLKRGGEILDQAEGKAEKSIQPDASGEQLSFPVGDPAEEKVSEEKVKEQDLDSEHEVYNDEQE